MVEGITDSAPAMGTQEPEQIQESEYEAGRRMKQAYLVEHVVNLGFDTTEFAAYMEYKRGNKSQVRYHTSPMSILLHFLIFTVYVPL